jgi:hypothetical protein
MWFAVQGFSQMEWWAIKRSRASDMIGYLTSPLTLNTEDAILVSV